MKISSKARYGLASMIYIAKNCSHNECITIINIANSLKISKIYLEQVFSLLKRANLVISIKGAQGGYQLARSIDSITAKDIIGAIELSLFDKTDVTVLNSSEAIEKVMETLDILEVFKNIQYTTMVYITQHKNLPNYWSF